MVESVFTGSDSFCLLSHLYIIERRTSFIRGIYFGGVLYSRVLHYLLVKFCNESKNFPLASILEKYSSSNIRVLGSFAFVTMHFTLVFLPLTNILIGHNWVEIFRLNTFVRKLRYDSYQIPNESCVASKSMVIG